MNQTVFLIGQCVSLRCALFPLNLGLPLHMQALASRHNPTLTTVAHCYNCLCKRQGLARTRTIAFPQHSCVLWYDGRTMEADNDNNSNEEEEDDDERRTTNDDDERRTKRRTTNDDDERRTTNETTNDERRTTTTTTTTTTQFRRTSPNNECQQQRRRRNNERNDERANDGQTDVPASLHNLLFLLHDTYHSQYHQVQSNPVSEIA